jgi:hypothetical protein
MRVRLAAALCIALLCSSAYAQDLTISGADSAQSVLAAQKGKRVTLRTRSGQELTGTVREVNQRMVVIAALGGREYFDAVVALDAVEAILVRTKQ